MLSSYYHAFTPGFNAWYVVLPLLMVIALLFGKGQYHLIGRKVKQRYNNNMFAITSCLGAGIMMILVACESFSGLIQFFDNHLGKSDSPFWSIPLALVVLVIFTMLTGMVMYEVSVWSGRRKKKRLVKSLYPKKNP